MVAVEAKRAEVVNNFSKLRQEADTRGVASDLLRSVLLQTNTDSNGDTLKCSGAKRTGGVRELFRRSVLAKFDEKNKDKSSYYTNFSSKNVLTSFLIFGILSSMLLFYFRGAAYAALDDYLEISTARCIVESNGFSIEISRPLMKCSICRSITQVPVEHNMSAADFKRKYAYTKVPVLVKNATTTWSAMDTFSFEYLRKIYTETDGALDAVEDDCQFFPYKTEFLTLADAFNMSQDRASFKEGERPWYIGWSNCHPEVKDILREHYQRPYFLPNGSESSSLDWIFMGGSGLGAFIHLDYVTRPSWQAQISGRKTWTLIPSPECEDECHSMNVTVEKGDIFVVDTNEWYHATYVNPGEISICIGSEYD